MKKILLLALTCIITMIACANRTQKLYESDTTLVHKLTKIANKEGSFKVAFGDTVLSVTQNGQIKLVCGSGVIMYDGGPQILLYQLASGEAGRYEESFEECKPTGSLTKVQITVPGTQYEVIFRKIIFYEKAPARKVYNETLKDSLMVEGGRTELTRSEKIILTTETSSKSGSQKTDVLPEDAKLVIKLKELYHSFLLRAVTEKKIP